MFQRRKPKSKGFLKGVLLGGIALGLTALLFTPKTGRQMRADLKKKYRSASKAGHDLYKNVRRSANNVAKAAKKRTKNLF